MLFSYEKRIDTFRIPYGYYAFAIEYESIFSLFPFIAKIFELMRNSVMLCLVDHCHTLSLAFQIVYLVTKSLQIKRYSIHLQETRFQFYKSTVYIELPKCLSPIIYLLAMIKSLDGLSEFVYTDQCRIFSLRHIETLSPLQTYLKYRSSLLISPITSIKIFNASLAIDKLLTASQSEHGTQSSQYFFALSFG